MFAKQTKKGRAIPLYFEIIRYPIPEGSQNIFIIQAILHFTEILGFKPRLVFDRGFAIPSLIGFLSGKNYSFVIRIKKSKLIQSKNGRVLHAYELKRNDALVRVYGRVLRLVISDKPETGESWYLVTNELSPSRNKIIAFYYQRFEIEEFFRDAKRLLRLEWVRIKTIQSLAILLWFVILGSWCLEHLQSLLSELQKKERSAMELSGIRYIMEKLSSFVILEVEGQFMNQSCL